MRFHGSSSQPGNEMGGGGLRTFRRGTCGPPATKAPKKPPHHLHFHYDLLSSTDHASRVRYTPGSWEGIHWSASRGHTQTKESPARKTKRS